MDLKAQVEHYRKLPYPFKGSAGLYGPAVVSSTIELPSLPDNLVLALDQLGWGVKPATIKEFTDMLSSMSPSWLSKYKLMRYPRKLASFPDKEGKMRTVAIFDYWSQLNLRPIHLALGVLLRRIPQDCTFDQGRFVTSLGLSRITDREVSELPVLSDQSDHGSGQSFPRFHRVDGLETYYSVDLSNATDRFPITLQYWVLSELLGSQVATAWREVMISLPFTYRSKGKETFVSFRTGQPMGAYSSFAAFALTHHVVVRALAYKLGVKADYAILGDDIVIRGDELGKSYLEFLCSCKIPYSPAKTFISKEMLNSLRE